MAGKHPAGHMGVFASVKVHPVNTIHLPFCGCLNPLNAKARWPSLGTEADACRDADALGRAGACVAEGAACGPG